MMRVGLENKMSPLTIKIRMKLYYMEFSSINKQNYDYTLLHIIYYLIFDCVYMFQTHPPKLVRQK